MTASKNMLRDLLGLALIVSIALVAVSLMLDVLAFFAYLNDESVIAGTFLHESLYFLVFIIPPYFIAKRINHPELVVAVEKYLLERSKNEQF